MKIITQHKPTEQIQAAATKLAMGTVIVLSSLSLTMCEPLNTSHDNVGRKTAAHEVRPTSSLRAALSESDGDPMANKSTRDLVAPSLTTQPAAVSRERYPLGFSKAELVNSSLPALMLSELASKFDDNQIYAQRNPLLIQLRASQLGNLTLGLSMILIVLFCLLLIRLNSVNQNLLAIRTALLSETQHRLKNNLQMVSSLIFNDAIDGVGQGTQQQMHQSISTRIRSMAILNDHICTDHEGTTVEAKPYISELLTLLDESIGSPKTTLHGKICNISIEADKATHLGLIICELVTNAYKHAFPSGEDGTISVELKSVGTTASLIIQDDGCGLQAKPGDGISASKGLSLIKTLAEQIEADVHHTSGNHGTIWTISGIVSPMNRLLLPTKKLISEYNPNQHFK